MTRPIAPPPHPPRHAAAPNGATRLVVTRDRAFEIREADDDLSGLPHPPDGSAIELEDRVTDYDQASPTPVEPGPRPAGGAVHR